MPRIHCVSQGECLSSIAARFGFANWRTIYDDSGNAALRQKRPNPNVLFPGDEVMIPDKLPKRVDAVTDQVHRFVVRRSQTRLRVQLCGGSGRMFSGKKYKLIVKGAEIEGTTNDKGMVDEPIPDHETNAELVLWLSENADSTCRFKLALGELDPANELTGAQARLVNLGFLSFEGASPSGKLDDKTRAALRAFQQKHGLVVSGALDATTSDKLEQLHDK